MLVFWNTEESVGEQDRRRVNLNRTFSSDVNAQLWNMPR